MKRAAVLVACVVLASAACSSPRPSPAAALTAWNSAASAALSAFGRQAATIGPQEQEWAAGALATPAFRADLARTQSIVASAASAVDRLPDYPGQPEVKRMYQASVALYSTVPTIQLDATTLPAGPLRAQVLRIADRVRELGDRVFDQGRVLTAQGLVPAGAPAGTELELPIEVPDWVAEGLAAGPPLAAAPAAPDRYPPLRQGPRPTESRSAWVAAVRADGAPALAELQTVLSEGAPPSALGAEAGRLQTAEGRVFGRPDPAVAHGREQSDRLRLALLVEAEACRAAQAADVVGPSAASASSGLAGAAGSLLQTAARIVASVTVLPS